MRLAYKKHFVYKIYTVWDFYWTKLSKELYNRRLQGNNHKVFRKKFMINIWNRLKSLIIFSKKSISLRISLILSYSEKYLIKILIYICSVTSMKMQNICRRKLEWLFFFVNQILLHLNSHAVQCAYTIIHAQCACTLTLLYSLTYISWHCIVLAGDFNKVKINS